MQKYFNCHNHTEYSNIRLIDCINRPKDLINKAIENPKKINPTNDRINNIGVIKQ